MVQSWPRKTKTTWNVVAGAITFDYRDYIEDGFNADEVLEECDGVPWGHYFVEDRAARPLFECPWMEIN